MDESKLNRLLRDGLKKCMAAYGIEHGVKMNANRLSKLEPQLDRSSLYGMLNGSQQVQPDVFAACLRALRVSDEEFLRRCDPAWHPERLKTEPGGQITNAGSSTQQSRAKAALDQLKASFQVAEALLTPEDQLPPTEPPGTIPRPRGPRKPPRP